MSDLAEIAAAAGIAIIDSEPDEGGDMKNRDGESRIFIVQSGALPSECGDQLENDQIREWDAMFSHRYTEADPEYVQALETAHVLRQPPQVDGFFCRRQRNDSRNWNRDNYNRNRYNDSGDRGGYRNRGGHGRDWNRRDGGGGWGRGDYRHDYPRNYGDHGNRGYGDHQGRGYNGQRDRGYNGQRDRGYSDQRDRGYNDQRDRGYGSQRDRDYGYQRDRGYGGQQMRGNGDQHQRNNVEQNRDHRQRDGDSGQDHARDRSPQR